MANKRATINDVAQLAGVSTSTVSHVVNKTRYVSSGITARVESAIKELGYIQHAAARGLASGHSNIIGLLVSDIANPFFPEVVKGVEEVAKAHNLNVLLANTEYDIDRHKAAVTCFLENRVSGILLLTSEQHLDGLSWITKANIPAVALDWNVENEPVGNASLNYKPGFVQVIQHLYNYGHRRIAFVSGPETFPSIMGRQRAFELAIADAPSHTVSYLETGYDLTIEGGFRAATKILSSPNPPTAIVCTNDMMALGAMQCAEKLGMRVPADLSVVGTDRIAFSDMIHPRLTTLDLHRHGLGKLVCEMLVNQLHGNAPTTEIITPEMVLGDSAGPSITPVRNTQLPDYLD